jgi:hypothetical protein
MNTAARRSLGQNPGLCQVQRYGSQVGVPVTTNFTYPPYYVDPCNPAAGPAAAPALAPGETFRSCPCVKRVLRLHTGKDLDASLMLLQAPRRFQVASRLARARLCAVLRSVSPGPRPHSLCLCVKIYFSVMSSNVNISIVPRPQARLRFPPFSACRPPVPSLPPRSPRLRPRVPSLLPRSSQPWPPAPVTSPPPHRPRPPQCAHSPSRPHLPPGH